LVAAPQHAHSDEEANDAANLTNGGGNANTC